MDDAPVAPEAAHGLAGAALDEACRAVLALPPHPALAGPAWWDANAPAGRVTYEPRPAGPPAPAPWPARRALDFCAELAAALAALHEAGASHGDLRPATVLQRPDGGPLVRAPGGAVGAAGDLHGMGVVLLHLLTGRAPGERLVIAGEVGPAAETAALLQGLLAGDPAARPASAREVAERLTAIAAGVPDTTPPPVRAAAPRRARLVLAGALLFVALAAGATFATQRVGPPGPALSPTTVTVPEPPGVTP